MSMPNDAATMETIAMANVPNQQWCEPYDLDTALKEGTIFPCLNLTFFKAPQGDSNIMPQSNTDNKEQLSREQAMNRLTAVSFAINDLTLYLDTHPNCENGLKLFYQLLDERMKLLAEYAGEFYPLTQTSMITGGCSKDMYGWSEGPAPWEGACV
ncbi:MAG: spore coat protein CotJB [Lachnospiraceae bacterium]|nr:spore coat protein CotJB [Lachnospiraceae bacterium]